MRRLIIALLFPVIAVLSSGCASTSGATVAEKRQAIQDMRQEVLRELYQVRPNAREQVRTAPGYAVFRNANVNVILASFGGGYGVLHNSRSGRDTYMKMGEAGIGFGMGVKDFRAVFIFHDPATLERFVTSGWEFGAQADAAAVAGDMGGAVAGEVVADNITVYQLTESGLALQATVKGTRYWLDGELN